METLLVIVSLIVIVGLLVFVHELGHFLAAKLSGVVVEEFALGFGPQLFSKKFKGTVYKVNLLPLGGYVRLEGERGSVGEEKLPGSYAHKPLRVKLFILSAGVIMNLLFAAVLFMVYLPAINYQTSIRKEGDFGFVGTESTTIVPPSLFVIEIEAQSPADGLLQPGDIITSLNGTQLTSQTQFTDFLKAHAGESVDLGVTSSQDFTTKDVAIKLREPNAEGKALLGVGASFDNNSYFVIKYYHNVLAGVAHAYNMFFYQISALVSLAKQSVAQANIQPLASEVGGVVAVAGIVNDLIVIRDFQSLINLTAIVSLSLAFVNFLPIPLFDGGQAAVEIFERLRRRKISDSTMEKINLAGLVFIIILFVVVTLKDIVQIGLVSNIISSIRDVLGR